MQKQVKLVILISELSPQMREKIFESLGISITTTLTPMATDITITIGYENATKEQLKTLSAFLFSIEKIDEMNEIDQYRLEKFNEDFEGDEH